MVDPYTHISIALTPVSWSIDCATQIMKWFHNCRKSAFGALLSAPSITSYWQNRFNDDESFCSCIGFVRWITVAACHQIRMVWSTRITLVSTPKGIALLRSSEERRRNCFRSNLFSSSPSFSSAMKDKSKSFIHATRHSTPNQFCNASWCVFSGSSLHFRFCWRSSSFGPFS